MDPTIAAFQTACMTGVLAFLGAGLAMWAWERWQGRGK